MKRFKLSFIFLSIIYLFTTCVQMHESSPHEQDTHVEKDKSLDQLQIKFQAVIDSIYTANLDVKGIIVHIESPSRNISWSGAVGYSDFNKKEQLEADQPALIASNTKTYVSATILRLVEMGKIQLGQPINDLLTEKTRKIFNDDGYKLDSIKVVHLLSHTSGIDDFAMRDSYGDTITAHPKHRWTRNEHNWL